MPTKKSTPMKARKYKASELDPGLLRSQPDNQTGKDPDLERPPRMRPESISVGEIQRTDLGAIIAERGFIVRDILTLRFDDGSREGFMLHFIRERRAAILWDGAVQWTSCETPEEAIVRLEENKLTG